MNTDSALNENGKICILDDGPDYAFENSDGVLVWNNKGENEPVRLHLITGATWQPYHEVKEIRPEAAGELWEKRESFYHTSGSLRSSGLTLHSDVGTVDMRNVIHGKDGWTREFPKVEAKKES